MHGFSGGIGEICALDRHYSAAITPHLGEPALFRPPLAAAEARPRRCCFGATPPVLSGRFASLCEAGAVLPGAFIRSTAAIPSMPAHSARAEFREALHTFHSARCPLALAPARPRSGAVPWRRPPPRGSRPPSPSASAKPARTPPATMFHQPGVGAPVRRPIALARLADRPHLRQLEEPARRLQLQREALVLQLPPRQRARRHPRQRRRPGVGNPLVLDDRANRRRPFRAKEARPPRFRQQMQVRLRRSGFSGGFGRCGAL